MAMANWTWQWATASTIASASCWDMGMEPLPSQLTRLYLLIPQEGARLQWVILTETEFSILLWQPGATMQRQFYLGMRMGPSPSRPAHPSWWETSQAFWWLVTLTAMGNSTWQFLTSSAATLPSCLATGTERSRKQVGRLCSLGVIRIRLPWATSTQIARWI